MGFDLLAAGLGELFFGGAEAAAAAAPEVGLIGADVGAGALEAGAVGAADIGVAGAADIGAAGAADLGAAGAADLGGAAAADIAGTAAPAADLGVAGAGAADLAGGVTPAVADTLAAAVPGAEFSSLGTSSAGGLPSSALSFAEPGAVAPAAAQAPAAAGAAAGADITGGAPGAAAQIATGEDPNVLAALDAEGPSLGQASAAPTASAATPSSAAPAAKVGGGLTSGLSDALNSPYTKAAELGIPLGLLGYTLAKGPAPIPPQAQTAISNAQAVDPALVGQATQNVPLYNQTAATDLNLANNFQINPAQSAAIATWKQDQYNQLRQQIANQGVTNVDSSSQWVQGKNQIDQQALAQQTQMINQLITTAFQASSAANAGVSTASNVTSQMDATLMQAAQLQVQQDQAFNQAVGSALQSFGLIAALSGKFGGSKDAATA